MREREKERDREESMNKVIQKGEKFNEKESRRYIISFITNHYQDLKG